MGRTFLQGLLSGYADQGLVRWMGRTLPPGFANRLMLIMTIATPLMMVIEASLLPAGLWRRYWSTELIGYRTAHTRAASFGPCPSIAISRSMSLKL